MYRIKEKKVNSSVHNNGKTAAQYNQMIKKSESGRCGCYLRVAMLVRQGDADYDEK